MIYRNWTLFTTLFPQIHNNLRQTVGHTGPWTDYAVVVHNRIFTTHTEKKEKKTDIIQVILRTFPLTLKHNAKKSKIQNTRNTCKKYWA